MNGIRKSLQIALTVSAGAPVFRDERPHTMKTTSLFALLSLTTACGELAGSDDPGMPLATRSPGRAVYGVDDPAAPAAAWPCTVRE